VTRAVVAGGVAHRPPRLPIHATFIRAGRTALAHPQVVVGTSVAWTASAAPLAAAFLIGRPELVVLAVLPLLLVATGVHAALAALIADRPFGWRALLAVDPVLAAVTWAGVVAVVALLSAGDLGVVAASLIGAAWVLVVPLALAYGAVRERRGPAALRGGMILALVRPELAVTAAALIVLATFAVVATAGALAICLPALVALFTARAVAEELAILDPGSFPLEPA
jgi:hypothetical protein